MLALRQEPLRNNCPCCSARTWRRLRPGKRQFDFARFIAETADAPACPPDTPQHELPAQCREHAATPAELHRKLDEAGYESIVIPHGTTWGLYTPPGSGWESQYSEEPPDPARQPLVELISGHGNAEEYRTFRAVTIEADGRYRCPAPTEGYLPACWRAGEIIRDRCTAAGDSPAACETRAELARQDYVNAGVAGHLSIGGEAPEDWLDAGQCKTCFLPAFNYRPGGSVQYLLARSRFDSDGTRRRNRVGFIGSSANHSARPGTGYKEFFRTGMTDAINGRDELARNAMLSPTGRDSAHSYEVRIGADGESAMRSTGSPVLELDLPASRLSETERQASYFLTGGLIAVHARTRDRNGIWDALERREVYATSGDRILLWFDLTNPPDGGVAPMGSAVTMQETPRFRVRAAGAYKQNPGCPEHVMDAVSADRLEFLCRSECHNPADERRLISRIEVVRILPQTEPDEAIESLIADPWLTHVCEPDPHGCTFTFTDDTFSDRSRDAVYYVRAIEAPSNAVNAGLARCEFDEQGQCVSVNLCHTGYKGDPSDDCLAPTEERAWSSPLYVDWQTR